MTMPQRRSILSNAGWNAFGSFFNIAMAFVLTPVIIHRLGVDQWGLLLLAWSVSGVLGLSAFGMSEATLRYIAHYHAEHDLSGVNRVFGATLTTYSAVCALVCAVIWVATPVMAGWVKVPESAAGLVEPLLRLTALLFSVGLIANVFHSVTMALERYDISNAIGVAQGIVRSAGLLALVLIGFEAVGLIVWEVFVSSLALVTHFAFARRLVPGLTWTPSVSLAGVREIFGYSTFAFLTHLFLIVYREAGKLIVGSRLGTASVAYLGTPDNVANRLHMIVVSAIETLVPRFAASRDPDKSRSLLIASTWAAFACIVSLYVPLAVLIPDLLRLWISPEFAQQSGIVGRLVAIGLTGSVAFSPIATYFRGTGRPGFVAAILAAVGLTVLVGSLLLIPAMGLTGVGVAYLLTTISWFGGLVWGWALLYGFRSLSVLARIAGIPLIISSCLGFFEFYLRNAFGDVNWFGLLIFGAGYSCLGAILVVTSDLLLGESSPARAVMGRLPVARRFADFGASLR